MVSFLEFRRSPACSGAPAFRVAFRVRIWVGVLCVYLNLYLLFPRPFGHRNCFSGFPMGNPFAIYKIISAGLLPNAKPTGCETWLPRYCACNSVSVKGNFPLSLLRNKRNNVSRRSAKLRLRRVKAVSAKVETLACAMHPPKAVELLV